MSWSSQQNHACILPGAWECSADSRYKVVLWWCLVCQGPLSALLGLGLGLGLGGLGGLGPPPDAGAGTGAGTNLGLGLLTVSQETCCHGLRRDGCTASVVCSTKASGVHPP
jgi:hypothetical protein